MNKLGLVPQMRTGFAKTAGDNLSDVGVLPQFAVVKQLSVKTFLHRKLQTRATIPGLPG